MIIRKFQKADLEAVLELYHTVVHTIGAKYYNFDAKKAFVKKPILRVMLAISSGNSSSFVYKKISYALTFLRPKTKRNLQMKKYIFSLATLALFSLEAQFDHRITSITPSLTDTQQPQYLVQLEIDQISENSDRVEFTKPQVLCLLGQEGEVNKYVEGKGGYIVKALFYKSDEKIKAKISVVVLDENKNEVYKSNEEIGPFNPEVR